MRITIFLVTFLLSAFVVAAVGYDIDYIPRLPEPTPPPAAPQPPVQQPLAPQQPAVPARQGYERVSSDGILRTHIDINEPDFDLPKGDAIIEPDGKEWLEQDYIRLRPDQLVADKETYANVHLRNIGEAEINPTAYAKIDGKEVSKIEVRAVQPNGGYPLSMNLGRVQPGNHLLLIWVKEEKDKNLRNNELRTYLRSSTLLKSPERKEVFNATNATRPWTNATRTEPADAVKETLKSRKICLTKCKNLLQQCTKQCEKRIYGKNTQRIECYFACQRQFKYLCPLACPNAR